jgi:ABC-type polysaccharide/polyol phosphate transport system ATPase subunit
LKSKFIGLFHKRYREDVEKFWALRDITLAIQAGESFGVIGRNGSGKSTPAKNNRGYLSALVGPNSHAEK